MRWTAILYGAVVKDRGGLPKGTLEYLTFDRFYNVAGQPFTATLHLKSGSGTIPAGTVAAQRMTVSGIRDGSALITFGANWYCSKDLDADWDLRDTGWRVVVDGDCPLDVQLRFDIPLDRMGETSPGYTANRAVNAVRVVCEAAPGIRTTVDLPQVVADLAPATS